MHLLDIRHLLSLFLHCMLIIIGHTLRHGDLLPLEIESVPLQWKPSLNYWTTGEVHFIFLNICILMLFWSSDIFLACCLPVVFFSLYFRTVILHCTLLFSSFLENLAFKFFAGLSFEEIYTQHAWYAGIFSE